MKMSEKQTGENESYVVLVVGEREREREREEKGCLRVCVMYEKLHEE